MARFELPRNSRSVATWQTFVCLLLAMLLVYNPFLSGAESGSGLCLRHSASNRATVGASELQHFSPIDGRNVLASDAVALLEAFEGLVVASSERHQHTSPKVFVASPKLPASLWFRPPPAQ